MDRLERLEMKYSEARAEYEQERSLNKDRMLNRIQKMEQEAKDREAREARKRSIEKSARFMEMYGNKRTTVFPQTVQVDLDIEGFPFGKLEEAVAGGTVTGRFSCKTPNAVEVEKDPHDHGPNCICKMCHTVLTPDHWGQHPNCHTCRCLQADKYQGILYEDTKDNRCGKYCYLWNCRDSNWIVGETESVYRKLIDGKLRIVGFRCRGKRYDKAERVNK